MERVTQAASVAGPKSQEKKEAGLATAFSGYSDGSTSPNIRTIGWWPTCEHDADPIPATVLDPFCGSGTVGEVCNPHRRKFVGLDLSSSYLRELALPRSENKSTSESITELPMFANLQEYPI